MVGTKNKIVRKQSPRTITHPENAGKTNVFIFNIFIVSWLINGFQSLAFSYTKIQVNFCR